MRATSWPPTHLSGVLALVGCFVCLASASAEPFQLFNGKNLEGWTYVSTDPQSRAEQVWSVKDGVLSCAGRPIGYLRTEKEFSDYVLTLQWRFPSGTKGGNSGVLLHVSRPNQIGIWPRSIEAQLQHLHAGDFWTIGETIVVASPETRTKGRRTLRLVDEVERPIGEWNEYRIECRGRDIKVLVNGTLVNEASQCSVQKGAIALQSEGAPIEFQKIEITPIDRAKVDGKGPGG